MLGMMMDRPLLIAPIMEFAARSFGDTEIVSRTVEGSIHRYTYRDAYARMQQLAGALTALGIQQGDCVGTLAWNTYRHFELYYGISGMGAVCHTLNPRLFPEQIAFIINHANDRFIFTDLTFLPLLEALAPALPKLEGVVVMTDRDHMPETSLANVHCYEDLLAAQPETFDWPSFDEKTASALCYTSGTTGNPKGALYSHRSTLLHALCWFTASSDWVSKSDCFLMVVPMFHVCAWGFPYACPLAGAKLVFPGPHYEGDKLHELIEAEQVTVSAGVPTIWLGLIQYLRQSGKDLASVRAMTCGGAAPPLALIQTLENDYGVDFWHGWGMTETSPIGTACFLRPDMKQLPPEEQQKIKAKQGFAAFGFDMKIVGPDGKRLPHDGKSAGELYVSSFWVIDGYFGDAEATAEAFDAEGWFRTGDVATIDPRGLLTLTDRTKDLIKSGGEWISSIDLENAVMAHPAVAEAAAIALPHPKWGERPLLVIVPKADQSAGKDEILEFLSGKVAKWWLPDDVVTAEELPHTSTGKVSKAKLREKFADYALPTV